MWATCLLRLLGLRSGGYVLIDEGLALGFICAEVLPEFIDIGLLKVVDGELLFVREADIAVGDVTLRAVDPDDVIDGIDILKEGCDAFESVGEFGAHGI